MMFILLFWANLAHAEEDAETVLSSESASESNETTATNSLNKDDVEARLWVLERDLLRMEAELLLAQQTPPAPVQNHPANGFNPSLTAFGDLHSTLGFHDGEVIEGSGPWLRSFELDVRSAVDPFADAVAVIAIEQGPPIDLAPGGDHESHGHGDHGEVEVHAEEVYVDFVALPRGLSARVGAFLQPFGVTNRSHPHDWPWPDTPLAVVEAFGEHGFRDVGAVLSWRTGLADSVALSLQGGALAGALGDEDSTGPGWIGRAEAFAEWGQSLDWELALGTSATGVGSAAVSGVDAMLRLRASQRQSIMLLAELLRNLEGHTGGYGALQVQMSRPFYLGLRVDFEEEIEQWGAYASIYTSEFLRFRAGLSKAGELWGAHGQLTFVWGSHPVEPYWVNR
jgi:hypothetical protein